MFIEGNYNNIDAYIHISVNKLYNIKTKCPCEVPLAWVTYKKTGVTLKLRVFFVKRGDIRG